MKFDCAYSNAVEFFDGNTDEACAGVMPEKVPSWKDTLGFLPTWQSIG
jgi:hypothetical protein